jgi:hypothetical protein
MFRNRSFIRGQRGMAVIRIFRSFVDCYSTHTQHINTYIGSTKERIITKDSRRSGAPGLDRCSFRERLIPWLWGGGSTIRWPRLHTCKSLHMREVERIFSRLSLKLSLLWMEFPT